MKGSTRIRISGGTCGGQYIHTPPRFHSRPTQDRVREALFSSLAPLLAGAAVLDLYAGSGALGIEALSRGAARATFVDLHPRCVETIRANLTHCGLEGTVVRSDALAYCRSQPREPFDLILLDPPYSDGGTILDDDPLLPLLTPLLRDGGRIVWEHAARSVWRHPDACGVLKTRRYGDTALSYLGREEDSPPSESSGA